MKTTVLVVVSIIMAIIIGVVLWATGVFGGGSAGSAGFGGNSENVQAVFLTNGQVYFGEFSQSAGVARLKNIYYLQVDQQQQVSQNDPTTQEPEVKLIKLGNELHGPRDEMRINPAQILFVEDLKDDGKVAEAIRRYEREGPDASTNEQPVGGTGTSSSSSSQQDEE